MNNQINNKLLIQGMMQYLKNNFKVKKHKILFMVCLGEKSNVKSLYKLQLHAKKKMYILQIKTGRKFGELMLS